MASPLSVNLFPPFPSELQSPPLPGMGVLPPTVMSPPDPEQPELVGNSPLDTTTISHLYPGLKITW